MPVVRQDPSSIQSASRLTEGQSWAQQQNYDLLVGLIFISAIDGLDIDHELCSNVSEPGTLQVI